MTRGDPIPPPALFHHSMTLYSLYTQGANYQFQFLSSVLIFLIVNMVSAIDLDKTEQVYSQRMLLFNKLSNICGFHLQCISPPLLSRFVTRWQRTPLTVILNWLKENHLDKPSIIIVCNCLNGKQFRLT